MSPGESPPPHGQDRRSRVPALARLLARFVAGPEDRDLVEADLEQRFRRLVRERGPGAARRWYWWQVARGVPAALRPDAFRLGGSGGEMRHALRALGRKPLYTAGVAGTLALGLGSAAAVASVAWTVWLAPMPFPDPDRVVRLYELLPPTGNQAVLLAPEEDDGFVRWQLSPPTLEDLRTHDWTTLQAVAGVTSDELDWSREGGTSRLTAILASPEVDRVLGLHPVAGRLLARHPDAAEVLLTTAFWERAFGGDPTVVGSTLTLDGVDHRIVGIATLPTGYPKRADLLLPLRFDPAQLTEGMRGARYLDGVARVAPGRTVGDADAEVDAFFRSLGERHAQHDQSRGQAVVLGEDLIRPYKGVLVLLLAAGGTFLALALVNVAGLVAARRMEDRSARWVRLALGATRARLLRSALVEGAALGLMASGAGLLGAWWLLSPIRSLVPTDIPRAEGLDLHPPVAAAVVLGGLAGGLLVGLLGHVLTRGAEPARGRQAARVRGASAPGLAWRRALVVGQVAFTTVLVTGGLVILERVAALQDVELGFEPEGVTSTQLTLSDLRYPSDEARADLWRALVEGMEARGLEAAVAVNPPMAGSTMSFGVRRDSASDQVFAQYHSVGPGYFRLMGTGIAEGRALGAGDGPDDRPVVVLDETLANELFPEGGAIGQVITVVSTPRTVVGVAAATRHFGPDVETPPGVYVPLSQDPWQLGHILVSGERRDASAALADVAGELDPGLGVAPLAPYSRYVVAWYAPLRLQSVVVGILAGVGAVLATLGLYALVAYHVCSRRKEIGIRMALGAPGSRLFGGVLAQGLALAGAGVALGIAGWYAALPLTRGLLEGADAGGPALPLTVALLVAGVSVLATLVPAWRSTAVDPVTTLAAE